MFDAVSVRSGVRATVPGTICVTSNSYTAGGLLPGSVTKTSPLLSKPRPVGSEKHVQVIVVVGAMSFDAGVGVGLGEVLGLVLGVGVGLGVTVGETLGAGDAEGNANTRTVLSPLFAT